MEEEEQQPKLVLPHHLHQDSARLNLVQTRHHQGRLGGTISGPWLGVGKGCGGQNALLLLGARVSAGF